MRKRDSRGENTCDNQRVSRGENPTAKDEPELSSTTACWELERKEPISEAAEEKNGASMVRSLDSFNAQSFLER